MMLPIVFLALSTIMVVTTVSMAVRSEGTRSFLIGFGITSAVLMIFTVLEVMLPRQGSGFVLSALAVANLSSVAFISLGRGVRMRSSI